MESMTNIEQLKQSIYDHPGIKELELFGKNLIKRPLNYKELKLFFATMWSFFRETPSGILNLALRINDYWANIDEWDAMAKSAYILSTAIDEFGLENSTNQFSATHHQLFQKLALHLNISKEDLQDEANILSAGKQIKEISSQFYRKEALSKSLGFHLASELTSWPEFKCFLEGFLTHKEHYRIKSKKDPIMKFLLVHTLIEPAHLMNSEKTIHFFLEHDLSCINLIFQGTHTYMEYYLNLFKQLNERIF